MKNCQKVKNAAAKFWGKFRIKKRLPPQKTLVSVEYGFYCAIARINRKSGGIGYRIIPDPKCGSWDIILTLDLLSSLGKTLSGLGYPTNGSLSNQKKYQHQTHRFGVFRCGSDGRIIPTCIFDVDLCGNRDLDSWFVKNTTSKTMEAVARKALNVSHRPQKTYYMTWQGQIERMNWIGVFEEEFKWHLTDKFHDLKEIKVYDHEMRDFAG